MNLYKPIKKKLTLQWFPLNVNSTVAETIWCQGQPIFIFSITVTNFVYKAL